MLRRRLALPFVVTTVASAMACGGNVVTFPGDTNAGGASASSTTDVSSTATGGTSVATAGAGGAGPATTVTATTSGAGGGSVECPTEPPVGWQVCEGSGSCTYLVACQSGERELSFACDGNGWAIDTQGCHRPYDSCPGTDLYCDGDWLLPQGTNPPSPCPAEPPKEGTECYAGGFGGVWQHCGYPCANGGWQIATCNDERDGQGGLWSHGPCQ